jgi:2,3-bisphosphoglycerate-dependent phosphoglycerate mutase
MPKLLLVRHGQSHYNLENRFTGGRDIALTALGEEEARLAGVKLMGIRIDVAYTSVLVRAVESLRIILAVMGEPQVKVVKDAALNERGYGTLEGLNKAETAQKYGRAQVETWRRSYEVCPPGGESLEKTYDRVIPYYKAEIEPRLKRGENVLVVAHGNSLRALMMYLEGISDQEIASINILTGMPRRYDMDSRLQILKVSYL